MTDVTWVVIDDHGDDAVLRWLPEPDLVVCADSGVALARRAGLAVDVVVGDMDSAERHDLDEVAAAGAELRTHDPDKDATDLALALRVAADRTDDGGTVVVVGGSGGRLDHAMYARCAEVSDML